LAVKKLKRHKSPGADKIPAELIKTVGRTICSEIHILTTWNKEELPVEWKESIIVTCYKKGDKTDCINLYPTNAPDPFKSASYECTKWVRCGHLNALHNHVRA